MKFTSEDLLNAMGLEVGDIIKFDNKEYVLYKNDYQGYHSYAIIETKPFGDVIKLINLLDWNYEIIQPKPTLTEDEKVILRNLNKRYKYINREEYGGLRISETKPIYSKSMKEYYYSGFDIFIYEHLFQFIKWEDEPYSIEELLKE